MEHRREELLDFVSWEDFWSSENEESRLYEAVLENFEVDDKWDRAAYEVEIKQPVTQKLPWYNQVMKNLFDKDYEEDCPVNEIDTFLLDSDEREIHYIELKKKKRNNRYYAVRQVDRASHLFQAIGYDFSASLVFFEDNLYESYPTSCFERTNPPREPVELEKVISNDLFIKYSRVDIEESKYKNILPVDPEKHDETIKFFGDQKPFWQKRPWKPLCLNHMHRWVEVKEPEINLKDKEENLFEWQFYLEPHDNFDEDSFMRYSEDNLMKEAELLEASENSQKYIFRIEKPIHTLGVERMKESILQTSERAWHSASSIQEIL